MFLPFLVQASTSGLDAVLDDPRLKGAIVGACVLDSGGKELYARNADLRLVPASNQKVITAAYALKTLGVDFRPTTRFWKSGNTVTVDSNGDPLLTYDELVSVRKQLKLGSKATVRIHSAYGPIYPTGWEWDDLRNKYAAPVSAFTVDRSSFELWAENGRAFFLPASYGARVVRKPGPEELNIDFDPRSMIAVLTGPLPDARTRLDTLALGRPDLAAGSVLGSKVERAADIPLTAPTLIRQGETMAEILREDLPSSDNNISENLLLMASGVKDTDVDPYQVAQGKVAAFLTDEIGLKPDEFKTVDGSGLSRHNVLTARALAKVQLWADAQPTRELWHASLVHPGEGTLKTRLAEVPFEGKTGSMDMVVSLSGFVHLKDGSQVVAAIMVNGQAVSTAETRDLLDTFIRKVLDEGNEGTLFAESHNHEGNRPDPRTGPASLDRLNRSDLHGRAAPTRDDSRDESAHAGLHRAQRVAVRGG